MSSMSYSKKDIDNLLNLDPSGILTKKLQEVNDYANDADNAGGAQVKVVAREVLKACNVIRPTVENLVTLP